MRNHVKYPMYLHTLGGLSLEGSAFRRPKPLLLLAYLALEGTKPRRYLAELFFMDTSDSMNSLSRALSYLRQEVPGVIEADNKKVWATVSCDASELLSLTDSKQFETCLELYQGAFAVDYELGLSEELEEWLYGTREILAAKARNAFLMLGENEAAKGNFSQAAHLAEKAYKLREVVELEPDDFGRLYNLLYAGNSPLAAEVREEAEGFDIPLELSREEAKAQLSEAVETAHDIPNNLPPPKTSFIGRDQELIEIAMQLAKKDCRLLTLHGMGGIGKSRLAVQAATEQLQVTNPSFKDGVYFVTLDALTSAELIPSSIAEALSLELQGQEDTLSQVKRFIGKKHILLLLDNYEHLMAGATLTSKLLETCPNLKLLVTSRERLNVEEEWVLTLDGLAVPTSTELSEAERFDALNLFVQRAKRAMLEFSLTQESLPHALKICQLVEGSPLGIELAAVWVKTLPVSEIAKEIESNLNILEAPTKNIPQRHQSIRAAFEHSWKLLTDKEQEVLRKLSVFVGGFRREAAAEVAGATLPILASLVGKSLLRVAENGRYDRHSLLYQYAREKLIAHSSEHNKIRHSHSSYYSHFLKIAEKALRGIEARNSMNTIEEELDNIRLAWNSVALENNSELFKSYALPLRLFFDRRGRLHEGIRLFSEVEMLLAQSNSEHHASLGYILISKSWLLQRQGKFKEACDLATQGLEQMRLAEDSEGVVECLDILAILEWRFGNFARSKCYLDDALTLVRNLADDKMIARLLGRQGILEECLGNYEKARRNFHQSLEISRRVENLSSVVSTLNNLATVEVNLGNLDIAESILTEGMEIAKELNLRQALPHLLNNLAKVALERRDYNQAELLGYKALGLAQEIGEKPSEIKTLITLSKISLYVGNLGKTQSYLRQGLEIAQHMDSAPTTLHLCVVIAEVLFKQNKFEEASDLLRFILQHPSSTKVVKDSAQKLLDNFQNRVALKSLSAPSYQKETVELGEIVKQHLDWLPSSVISKHS